MEIRKITPLVLLKNWWYHSPGFGKCARCDASWAWKKVGDVKYSDTGSMFPVCADCQNALEPIELYAYCEKLAQFWETLPLFDGEIRKSKKTVLQGVRKTLGINE